MMSEDYVYLSGLLKTFQDPGALINWAWKVGASGKSLTAATEEVNAGKTLARAAMEFLRRVEFQPTDDEQQFVEVIKKPLGLFKSFCDEHKIVLVDEGSWHTDDQLKLKGYTIRCKYDGTTMVLDIKHGRGLYLNDVLLAAGNVMLSKAHGAVVIRFNPDNALFDVAQAFTAEQLEDAQILVRMLCEANDVRSKIKREFRV
jgi:hypothetical protein